jgi:hypothetical protein
VAIAEVLIPAAFNAIIPAGNITDVRPRRLDQPWNSAWGVQAVARITTQQGGINTVETDLPGLTVTATTVANRRYRISATVPLQSTVANDIAQVKITDAANVVQVTQRVALPLAAVPFRESLNFTLVPPAGSSTYKVRVVRHSGTGNISAVPTTTDYSEIVFEDIGPSPGTAGTLLDELTDRMETP